MKTIWSYLHCAWKYLMRFCSRSTPFLTLISLTLRRYCGHIGQFRSTGTRARPLAFQNKTHQLSFQGQHRSCVASYCRKCQTTLGSEPPVIILIVKVIRRARPRTSAAGRTSSPSPSPRRFLPRWFPCGSSRVASRAPSSPSLSWC